MRLSTPWQLKAALQQTAHDGQLVSASPHANPQLLLAAMLEADVPTSRSTHPPAGCGYGCSVLLTSEEARLPFAPPPPLLPARLGRCIGCRCCC